MYSPVLFEGGYCRSLRTRTPNKHELDDLTASEYGHSDPAYQNRKSECHNKDEPRWRIIQTGYRSYVEEGEDAQNEER